MAKYYISLTKENDKDFIPIVYFGDKDGNPFNSIDEAYDFMANNAEMTYKEWDVDHGTEGYEYLVGNDGQLYEFYIEKIEEFNFELIKRK